jgi:integrase
MRKGEVLNLKRSSIDLKEGLIRLKKEDTKTKSGRSVPIHREARDVLEKILKVPSLHSDRVFHRDGKPINEHHIRTVHEKVCKDAEIENFTIHDFRHTCINNWRKDGHDYFKIMAPSGHRTMSVFKRYNLVDEIEVKSLVEKSEMETYVDTTAKEAK